MGIFNVFFPSRFCKNSPNQTSLPHWHQTLKPTLTLSLIFAVSKASFGFTWTRWSYGNYEERLTSSSSNNQWGEKKTWDAFHSDICCFLALWYYNLAEFHRGRICARVEGESKGNMSHDHLLSEPNASEQPATNICCFGHICPCKLYKSLLTIGLNQFCMQHNQSTSTYLIFLSDRTLLYQLLKLKTSQ